MATTLTWRILAGGRCGWADDEEGRRTAPGVRAVAAGEDLLPPFGSEKTRGCSRFKARFGVECGDLASRSSPTQVLWRASLPGEPRLAPRRARVEGSVRRTPAAALRRRLVEGKFHILERQSTMTLEAVVICVDCSAFSRDGDAAPSRLVAQRDAAEVVANAYLNQHRENAVALLAMGGVEGWVRFLLPRTWRLSGPCAFSTGLLAAGMSEENGERWLCVSVELFSAPASAPLLPTSLLNCTPCCMRWSREASRTLSGDCLSPRCATLACTLALHFAEA